MKPSSILRSLSSFTSSVSSLLTRPRQSGCQLHNPITQLSSRLFHSSRTTRGFEEFFHGAHEMRTGRYWRCSDLRNKSFDDLHKLWFVLLKERNMLLTYEHFSRLQIGRFTHLERKWKVRRSMANIKVVLGERHRKFRELTEPKDSPWRKMVEERRRKKRLIRRRDQQAKHPPKQVFRRSMFSPLRKKIAFRNLKPRVVNTEPTVQSQ